ncbi:MAG TPA: RNA polymerase sigma factor [Amycolatopsis sp.]|nr:RNA polymerase sigma factor [Amycolatopsis sp.]
MAEQAGVEALYRDYAEPLRRYVRRVAASRGLSESLIDTEGVVHEAFASMLDTQTTIEDPPAWLFTVARRLVGKIAARHRSRAEGDPQELLHTDTTQWTSLTARTSTEDIVEAREVLGHLAALPDRQKIAVYLRHVQGWSAAEIGDYLKCAPATAHVHIHRGRRSLQVALAALFILITSSMMMVKYPDSAPADDDPVLILMVVIVVVLGVLAVVDEVRCRRRARREDPGKQAPPTPPR